MICPNRCGALDPIWTHVGDNLEHRITGYLCPSCRYYDSLWKSPALGQNGIGLNGGDGVHFSKGEE